MKFNHHWLLAVGIAIPALFPNIAHSKSADDYVCPPKAEMCNLVDASLRKHVGTPAPKPVAKPKPKARPIVPATPPAGLVSGQPLSERQARVEADAAMSVVFAFNSALRR